jgi:hypothetical protein
MQPKHTRGKKLFASRPPKDLKIHKYALHLRKSPWNYLGPCNVALGGLGRRGWKNYGDLAGGLGRGSVWEGSRVRLWPFWVLTCCGEMVGGHRRRDQAAAAAGAVAPAKMWPGLGNKRRQDNLKGLGKTPEWLDGWEKERAQVLGVQGSHGAVAAVRQGAMRAGGDRPTLYRQARQWWGVSLCAPRLRGHGMGGGLATVRRQRHRPGGTIGTTCPCAWGAWPERRGLEGRLAWEDPTVREPTGAGRFRRAGPGWIAAGARGLRAGVGRPVPESVALQWINFK